MLVRNLRKIKPLLRSLFVSRGPGFEPRRLTTKDNSTADSERTNPRSFKMMVPKTILDNPFRCDPFWTKQTLFCL